MEIQSSKNQYAKAQDEVVVTAEAVELAAEKIGRYTPAEVDSKAG